MGINFGKFIDTAFLGMTNFSNSGFNDQNAVMSGIPFIGEGYAAQQQQQFSAQQAKDQMAFQKEMSSTAHQREVADLRAAGLNPILSAGGSSGASTPAGAMASGSANSGAASSAKFVQDMYNLTRENAEKDLTLKDRQDSKMLYETFKADQERKTSKELENYYSEQQKVLKNTAKSVEKDVEAKGYDNQSKKNEAEFQNQYGEGYLMIKRALELLMGGSNSANTILKMFIPRQNKGGKK